MKIGDLFVKLGLDVSAFQKGMGLAAQSLTGMKTSLNALRAAAVVALGSSVLSLFGAMASKAAEQEQTLVRLQQAVENTGGSYEGYSRQIAQAVDAGRKFGFSGDEQRSALALLVTQTGSVEEGLRRLAIAYDVARATQYDLYHVSRLLGKVTEENVVGLNRIGIAVRNGANEEEFFEDVLRKVGGQAQAQSGTIKVMAATMTNSLSQAFTMVSQSVTGVAPTLAALAIAFEQTGLRGKLAAGGIGALGVSLKAMGASAVLATKAVAGLLVALVPFAAMAVAGVALAVALGKVGQALDIPILRDVGESFDKFLKIIQKIGVGGFLGELAGELFGIGREAPQAASATDMAKDAIQRFSKTYGEMTARLQSAGAFPGGQVFKQIEDAMRAFAKDVPGLTQSLKLIEDTLAGVRGMGTVDATRALGAGIRANLVKVQSAEVKNMEALRDSAQREMESVARFWADEADRRADFARTMAERALPVIETIDQLTRDMGEGFDNAKRAAQAEALRARFSAETAELQRREAERISRVRAPETPTMDRIVAEFGSLDALDAHITELHRLNAEVFAALDELIAGVVKRETDAIAAVKRAKLVLLHPEIEGEDRKDRVPLPFGGSSKIEPPVPPGGYPGFGSLGSSSSASTASARGAAAVAAATAEAADAGGGGAAVTTETETPPESQTENRWDRRLAVIEAALAKLFGSPPPTRTAEETPPTKLTVDINITAAEELKELRVERIEQIARDAFAKIAAAAEVIVRQVGGSEASGAMIVP